MNPSPLDRVQKVLDIMRMHGIKPDDASFGMLIGNAAQRKDITSLDALLTLARKEGVTLNTKLYTAAMNAYITAGDKVDYFKRLPLYRSAREIFEEMQRVGCQPNDVTYNTIIRGCTTVAEAEAIWLVSFYFFLLPSLCTFKLTLGRRKHMQENSVQPSPRFFNTMLSILAQRGQLPRLVYFTELMRAKGIRPELQTFVSLIVGLCNARMPYEAMSYWEEMQKLGLNHRDPRVLRALYVGFSAYM